MSWQPQYQPQYQGPMRRQRGWGRVLIGAAMIVGGIVAIILGIVAIVGEVQHIEDDAVARGQMGETLTFTASEPGDYTVNLNGANVGATGCRVQLADGGQVTLTGAQQDVEYTLGDSSSIGRFDTGAGDVEINCQPQIPAEYFVSPGTPGIVRTVFAIIAGAFAIFGGIGLLIWGLIGKRVPA
jgi:hypothetical protein